MASPFPISSDPQQIRAECAHGVLTENQGSPDGTGQTDATPAH
jgi:hypothetical protein